MLLDKVIYDDLLRRVVIDMDGREVLAFLIDEDYVPGVSRVKVFFYLLGKPLVLNGISQDHDAVEPVVVHEFEDRRIADGTSLGILILDIHRENGDIVITLEGLLKEPVEEGGLRIFLRLSDEDSYLFAYPVCHT